MTMTLTARDKKLLYFLALLLLAVGIGYFLIMPELDRSMDLRDQLDLLQAEYDKQLQVQAEIPSLKKTTDALEAEILTLTGSLYDRPSSADVDDLLTGLLLSHELKPRRLDIGSPQKALLEAYIYADTAAFGAAGSTTSATISSHIVRVTGTAQGNQEQWLRLLDTLHAGYPAIRVAGFSLETVQERTSTGLRSYLEISFAFDLYCQEPWEVPEA